MTRSGAGSEILMLKEVLLLRRRDMQCHRKDETLGERIRTLGRWVIAWSDPIVVASGGDE